VKENMTRNSEALQNLGSILPDGIKLSKGAQDIINDANNKDVSPGLIHGYVAAATSVAVQEGRRKVGSFGDAGRYFDMLKEAVVFQDVKNAQTNTGRYRK
jgi:hypothetical protein